MCKQSHILKSKHCIYALMSVRRKSPWDANSSSKSQISHTCSLFNTFHCNSFDVACSITQKRCQKIDDGKVLLKLIGFTFLLSYKKLDRVACAPVLCINASSSRGIQEPQLSSETTLITLICFRERLSRVTRYLWESSTLVIVGDNTNYIYFFGE